MPTRTFAARLLQWWRQYGRKDLPWQQERTPYRVWISEVMLQQTQVATVIPYFERFVARYPTADALARAADDDVMHLWAGLGYYARARNMLAAARAVANEFAGTFPSDPATLATLPGIGRSTANAIHALATGGRAAILDGNVKRVLCRWRGIEGFPGDAAIERRLWALAEELVPDVDVAHYTQAQMDLGATVCTRRKPTCEQCPLREDCVAVATNRTDVLPAPRPARVVPERSTTFWMLRREDGAVLLERRPPTGIWGGLWSLPESALDADAHDVLRRFGVRRATDMEPEDMPEVEHTFTHFQLRIRPRLLAVSEVIAAGEPQEARADTLWYTPGYHRIGLAAPVARLLDRHFAPRLPDPAVEHPK